MMWTIAVVLIILWILGMGTGFTMGSSTMEKIVSNKELLEGGFHFSQKSYQSKNLLSKIREVPDK